MASAVLMLATFLVPTSAAAAGGLTGSKPAATQTTGTVTGTVTVTGAPSDFSPALLAVAACRNGSGTTCSSPQLAEASGGLYSLILRAGTWHLQGFYVLEPYGGALLGSSTTVTVTSGGTIDVDLSLAYEVPGAVKGTVSVTKIPSGVAVTGKVAIVCPSSSPNPNGAIAEYVCATATYMAP